MRRRISVIVRRREGMRRALTALILSCALLAAPAWAAVGGQDDFMALCRKGTAAQVRAALEAGADAGMRNEQGSTALMVPAHRGAKAGRERLKLM